MAADLFKKSYVIAGPVFYRQTDQICSVKMLEKVLDTAGPSALWI